MDVLFGSCTGDITSIISVYEDFPFQIHNIQCRRHHFLLFFVFVFPFFKCIQIATLFFPTQCFFFYRDGVGPHACLAVAVSTPHGGGNIHMHR